MLTSVKNRVRKNSRPKFLSVQKFQVHIYSTIKINFIDKNKEIPKLKKHASQNTVKRKFYNSCLISRALIGSFLSSIRVQTDKILIYASFQVQLSAVKLSTF